MTDKNGPPVAPVASADVQAFVDALELPWLSPQYSVRDLAVQAITAWQARAPVASDVVTALQRAKEWLQGSEPGRAQYIGEVLDRLAVAPVASKSVDDCMELHNEAVLEAQTDPKYRRTDRLREAQAALQAAIVAYGDAQWNAAIEAAAGEADGRYWPHPIAVAIRGLKR